MRWISTESLMRFLKRNSVLVLILNQLGCASSIYQTTSPAKEKSIITVTADRLSLECENLQSDEAEYYGFSIYILDEEKTVTSVIQTNPLDKGSCEERYSKVAKIIRNGKQVNIFGYGSLKESRVISDDKIQIGGRGFPLNGRVLQFIYIINDKGECFNGYQMPGKPCAQE